MPSFKLTKNNYYSVEANERYWSASFVKGMLDCPTRTIAEFSGFWTRPANNSLMVGSFVDAAFEGPASLRKFKAAHKEIYNVRTGELKSDYKDAERMVARAKSDPVFMDFMHGQKQKIFTGFIDKIPFKCRMDVYQKGSRIVDLKTVKDMSSQYVPGRGRVNFAQAWYWPLQMAIYQELTFQNTGDRLPCFLTVITKQDPPDLAIVEIPQETLDAEMEFLHNEIPRMDAIIRGIIPIERCEDCAYCRQTKSLKGPISLNTFDEGD